MALTELVIMPGKDYKDICNAVRKKTGTDIVYTSGQVSGAIDSIVGGKDQPNVVDTTLGNVGAEQMLVGYTGYAKGKKIDGKIQSKDESTINPSTTPQYIEPGVYLSGRQIISAIQTETKTVTTNGVVTPSAGKYLTSVTVEVPASGVQLPHLDNPGEEEHLVSGKELIDQNGQKIVGTNPYEKNATDQEILEQSILIQDIKTALAEKAAGGIELPPLDDSVRATSADIANGKCLYDENGNIVEGSVTTANGRAVWKNIVPALYEDDNNSIILSPNISKQYLLRDGMAITSPLSNFGNATADQVAKGATFTSAAGLLVEGNATIGGGGYAIKSGTTTSRTINTGLSDVEQFFMYEESVTAAGLIHLHYTKSATSRMYASAWTTSNWGTKTITNGTDGVTVSGGTVTISATQAAQGALASNVTYKWVAIGTE